MDLCWLWGQKSKGHILSLNFVPFPNGGPISFWHTVMIWWGQEVKCKGYIYVYISCLNYWLFPYCYSITLWHTIMILHTCVSYEPMRTSIYFGVKRSWFTWKVWICCRAGGGGVPLNNVNFKWMWVGSRVNDIYVYTLPALVYSLHHDQTLLNVHYQWKFEPIRCDSISYIFLKVVSGKCGTQWRI